VNGFILDEKKVMSLLKLLVAPPASGKTSYLIELARETALSGKRVWWVGLPSQRSYVYRRATEKGAVLGLEFLSSQQVYYRFLANALKLKPLVVGTGRLALVGEALKELRQELPAPGEARLFAQAIAEIKRFGLDYKGIAGNDEESKRLRDVFRRYEAVKGDKWDYDDFRLEAFNFAECMEKKPEAELIIVDGFREIGPLELRIYKALAKHTVVWLSLPQAPPNEVPTQGNEFIEEQRRLRFHRMFSAQEPSERTEPMAVAHIVPYTRAIFYRAPNPVSESRWVLRSLKKDLAEGMDSLDLAVILPEREVKAFISLADEYGVPLMDETPKALADTIPGRLLLDLLELPDYPTASKLLAIPELAPLANQALNKGIGGLEAINVLAAELELGSVWQKWFGVLQGAEDNPLEWAEQLLETTLPELRKDLLKDLSWEAFKKQALQRAKEASSLGKGASFRAWWGALLQESFMFDQPKGGVALVTATLVSGRQFQKAYLMHAVEGAYTVGEGEDYFIPEEYRGSLETSFARLGLPKRFLGRDQFLYAELLTRAKEMVITFPEADQGGPLVPEVGLIDLSKAERLPLLPAASRLELPSSSSYRADFKFLKHGSISLQKLQRYDQCGFRYWAEERIKNNDPLPWWRKMLDEMRDYKRLNVARFEVLKGSYPEAAVWLNDYAEKLEGLQFGETVSQEEDGFRAYIDAVVRSGNEIHFYRFVEPGLIKTTAEAAEYIDGRWNELWSTGNILERYKGRISKVQVWIWPILAEPIACYDGGITYLWKRIATCQKKVASAYERFASGDTLPKPGFHCRECNVFDVCREGKR
jgi:ATP-dependent helicase/nuclease subunit B